MMSPSSFFSLFTVLILLAFNPSIDCSYHYVGCYTQVFHDSYFTSSFMEPTLCFRLCDTPIIYLQKTICRCSGGGLMHHNRQSDQLCATPCTQPVDRVVKTSNTCGGQQTYSAYVEEKFYTRHGHLFDYRIEFSSCELWKSTAAYETYEVEFSQEINRTSLNRLELCAATCLDQNATTKSIAFNGNISKCICIMPVKSDYIIDRSRYITSLSNSSCDRYCNNSYEGSKKDLQFPCGALNNSLIWAVYNLNGSCPTNFIYVKEFKKCVSYYKNFWNSCTPPSTAYIFDGSLSWTGFLKVIAQLQLNSSAVTIDFDEDIYIDRSWKCGSSSTALLASSYWSSSYGQSRSTLYGWNSNTRYILENGCLREGSYASYASYSHRYSHRLCVADAINQYALSNNEDNSSYIFAINPLVKYCPSNWFDLNGRCYRISDERKSLEQAKSSCINVTTSTTTQPSTSNKPQIWLFDVSGHVIGGDELNGAPTGEIVEYVSPWQARLGFFLLDTDPDHDGDDADPATTTQVAGLFYDESLVSSDDNETITPHGAIDEFQAINYEENKNTCVVITRSRTEEKERPILRSTPTENCTQPRHVLCETNTLVVQSFQYECLKKPNTFDLPALISDELTHELCLAVCQELQTKFAVVQMNKCYCLQGSSPTSVNISTDFAEYRRNTCGNVCAGNSYETCGDEDTIVAFQILDSRRTFTHARTPAEPFPSYVFDNCINLNIFNRSIIYRLTITDKQNIHPRFCLAFCTQYKQKYALMNNHECLCTNIPLSEQEESVDIIPGQSCSQPCAGNYFYSCGHHTNKTVYSAYVLLPKCRHGFEVAANDQQCVYSHFSAKVTSLSSANDFCRSIGGKLAKINDMVEIQDILPESILHTRLMQQILLYYKFKFINDSKWYWIERTNDTPDPNTVSERLIKQCSKMPEMVDRNCLAIQYVPNADQSHERCIIETDECSTRSAMPVCVDEHIEYQPTMVPSIDEENPGDISVNITVEHSCDEHYDLIDDFCYRLDLHEVGWNEAQSTCHKDHATIFIPEKSVSLQYIKSIFLRRKHYVSSGFAHVGVYYDRVNRTVVQYNMSNTNNDQLIIPDSNAIYDICEKSFQERFTALMLSMNITLNEKNRLRNERSGCGYIDLLSNIVPTIRCDEIPCNRTATVICQKFPTIKTQIIPAKRVPSTVPPSIPVTNPPSSIITTTIPSDDPSSSSDVVMNESSSSIDTSNPIKSISRDFAPMFFILAILGSLFLLGMITTLYNRRRNGGDSDGFFGHSRRRHTNAVYSRLTSANEFDLN